MQKENAVRQGLEPAGVKTEKSEVHPGLYESRCGKVQLEGIHSLMRNASKRQNLVFSALSPKRNSICCLEVGVQAKC